MLGFEMFGSQCFCWTASLSRCVAAVNAFGVSRCFLIRPSRSAFVLAKGMAEGGERTKLTLLSLHSLRQEKQTLTPSRRCSGHGAQRSRSRSR